MGLEFTCAAGDCEFTARNDDRDDLLSTAREHLETEHQLPADSYDIEEDIGY